MSNLTANAVIDTAKAEGFRALRFSSIDDALAEVERLVEAERAGRLRRVGNWTLGQALGHIASWIDYAYDGYPGAPPPWFIRAVCRMMKQTFVTKPARRGFKIPRIEGGTHGAELLSTDHGADRCRRAFQRLRAAPPSKPNPVFGPLTHEQWIQLHLRHAELHLGYQVPG
jgi:hypothetical protein